jgi:hypothetical protein
VNRSVSFLVSVLGAAAMMAVFWACTDNGSAPSGGTGDPNDAASDSTRPRIDASNTEDGGDDAATLTTCQITRAYVTDCDMGMPDGGDGLTCGNAKFDAWCALNDKAINSEAYHRAEAMCLTHANCDPDKRRDCEYKTYATAIPTTAQTQVALAYCQTCEPADPKGCVTRETTYKSALGPKSTDDVFVAAWELNDALDDEIRTKCTGAALDAGATPDGGACLKQFASCAGDIYINHLPDCP